MGNRVYNVLFLCTGNSARSIMAEAILNRLGRGRFRAYSAGSRPIGRINPLAMRTLADNGLTSDELRNKGWEEFARPDAPMLDFIFTVCDNAARESCPAWPGNPTTAHWGIPDHAAAVGGDEDVRRAFRRAYRELDTRIRRFLALPMEALSAVRLRDELRQIGNAEWAAVNPRTVR